MPAAAIRKGMGGHVAAGRSFLLSIQLHDCCMGARLVAEAQREPRLAAWMSVGSCGVLLSTLWHWDVKLRASFLLSILLSVLMSILQSATMLQARAARARAGRRVACACSGDAVPLVSAWWRVVAVRAVSILHSVYPAFREP